MIEGPTGRRSCSGRPISYDLEAAFRTRLIGGPGAFVVTADSRETFADAVRRKLLLEITGAEPATRFASARAIIAQLDAGGHSNALRR